jgi:hypothetical protein
MRRVLGMNSYVHTKLQIQWFLPISDLLVGCLGTTEGSEIGEDCNVLPGHGTIGANQVAVRVCCPRRELDACQMDGQKGDV